MLWRGLTGVHVSSTTARHRLNAHFSSQQQLVGHSHSHGSSAGSAGSAASAANTSTAGSPAVTVCLVDELDYLMSRNHDVMYHFYSWPQHLNSNFILLGIANTMDLPERLSTR
jgi:hypothetical protein